MPKCSVCGCDIDGLGNHASSAGCGGSVGISNATWHPREAEMIHQLRDRLSAAEREWDEARVMLADAKAQIKAWQAGSEFNASRAENAEQRADTAERNYEALKRRVSGEASPITLRSAEADAAIVAAGEEQR